MKKNNLILCLILIFVIAFNLIVSKKVSESYENGQTIKFANNYCTRLTKQDQCEVDWQKKGYVAGLANNGVQLGGNPCMWLDNACSNTTNAVDLKYEFTGPTM
jgi:hypothetical protein